jgi:hypothetical protein
MLASMAGARNSGQTAFLASFCFFTFCQPMLGPFFCAQREIGQGLAAQRAIDEEDHQQRKSKGGRVQQAANPLPADLQGIVKDLFGHLGDLSS